MVCFVMPTLDFRDPPRLLVPPLRARTQLRTCESRPSTLWCPDKHAHTLYAPLYTFSMPPLCSAQAVDSKRLFQARPCHCSERLPSGVHCRKPLRERAVCFFCLVCFSVPPAGVTIDGRNNLSMLLLILLTDEGFAKSLPPPYGAIQKTLCSVGGEPTHNWAGYTESVHLIA